MGHTWHAQWGECSGSVLSAPSVLGTFILVWEKALPCSEYDVPMSQLTGKHFLYTVPVGALVLPREGGAAPFVLCFYSQ